MCGASGTEEVVAKDPDAEFLEELRVLINRNSRENVSNTPDFILAGVMHSALVIYEASVNSRDQWYGCSHKIKGGI